MPLPSADDERPAKYRKGASTFRWKKVEVPKESVEEEDQSEDEEEETEESEEPGEDDEFEEDEE